MVTDILVVFLLLIGLGTVIYWTMKFAFWFMDKLMKNPCKKCDFYHSENNTCQSKKCVTMGDGYVNFIDRLFCEPKGESDE